MKRGFYGIGIVFGDREVEFQEGIESRGVKLLRREMRPMIAIHNGREFYIERHGAKATFLIPISRANFWDWLKTFGRLKIGREFIRLDRKIPIVEF